MKISRGIVGPALIYTITNAISSGLPFFLLPFLTRVLTPAEYGTIAMFSVVVTVLGAFTGLSVHGAIGIRFFEQDRYDLPRYVSTCLLILFVSTIFVFCFVALLSSWLEAFTKLPLVWLFVAVLVSGAQFVIQIQLALWQAARRPWQFGAARIFQSFLDAVLSLTLILYLGMAWEGRLFGISIATFTCMIAILFALRSGGYLKLSADKQYAVNALKFGVPLIPHVIGGMLIVMTDRFLISNVLDVSSTGIYMVAMQIGMALGLLTDSFNRAFSPWLIESLGKRDVLRDRKIVYYTYVYFVVVSVIAILIGLTAPYFLGVLVGEQYQAAANIVIYITMGFAFGGMYYMVTNYIFYAGNTAGLAAITFFAGVFNIAVTYWLLRRYGLVGAAQGFMLSQAVTFLGAWWLAQKSRPMPWGLKTITYEK
jgi:O-antigen/teichoic acid export membrane protein